MMEPAVQTSTKIDWQLIGLLFVLVLPLRLWLLHNTEVAARDSITFVQYALQFDDNDWRTVACANQQHPGYPALVWLMSLPVRALDGPATPANMALATQLVSLAASLLLILPMYWLGRAFFDRKICFGAALLYQYLPISAQHLSDGLSEPVYLLLIVSGLLHAVQAVRKRSWQRAALCGFFAGLAYLTRPEGVLILAAGAAGLILLQFRNDWRCSWKQFYACGTAMTLAALLAGSPFVIATGRISNKPIYFQLTGQRNPWPAAPTPERADLAIGTRILFAASFPRSDSRLQNLGRSVWAVAVEINQGLHYVAGAFALLGLAWSLARWRLNPGSYVVAGYCSLHSVLLIALAMSANYVSDRHVMILVLFSTYFVVIGLTELPRRVLAWRRIEGPGLWRSGPAWSALLGVALLALCLPKATQRLHGNRAGNHAAGLWLSRQVQDNDIIVDEYDWSRYYSGLFLQARHEPAHPPTCYIVTTNGRGPQMLFERSAVELRPDAKVVFTWPDAEKARIVVYAQPKSKLRVD